MNIRPVRLPPWAAGASPTSTHPRSRVAEAGQRPRPVAPRPGSGAAGRPPRSSRHSTRRGQRAAADDLRVVEALQRVSHAARLCVARRRRRLRSPPMEPKPASDSERASWSSGWGSATPTRPASSTAAMVMKLCDEAAGIAAIRHCRRRVVTAAMDRMTFILPVNVGELVTCTRERQRRLADLDGGRRPGRGREPADRRAPPHLDRLPDDGRGGRRRASPTPVPPLLAETDAEQPPPARGRAAPAATASPSASRSSPTAPPRRSRPQEDTRAAIRSDTRPPTKKIASHIRVAARGLTKATGMEITKTPTTNRAVGPACRLS